MRILKQTKTEFMKKLFLLSALALSAFASFAQLSLSGTSPYNQDFNAIGSGLPTGWVVYSGSAMTTIGALGNYSPLTADAVYSDTTCGNITGGFKNLPSANNTAANGATCTAQQAFTDRALGVRQVSPLNTANPNLDSGAAFVLKLSNTGGISNLACSFKLQSLDSSSPRTTTWRVQYAVGSTTSWTEVTPTGTMTTGGHTFSNNNISASFGSALDNKSSNVYIRIVTLDFSSSVAGSGNRASTGIDDFQLTWTGSAGINDLAAQATLPLSVVSASTSAIVLNFDAENAGEHTVVLTDLAGHTVATKVIAAGRGNQNITIDGVNLASGMYIAKITNGVATGVTKVAVQ